VMPSIRMEPKEKSSNCILTSTRYSRLVAEALFLLHHAVSFDDTG
jgi:hypothetical protein